MYLLQVLKPTYNVNCPFSEQLSALFWPHLLRVFYKIRFFIQNLVNKLHMSIWSLFLKKTKQYLKTEIQPKTYYRRLIDIELGGNYLFMLCSTVE